MVKKVGGNGSFCVSKRVKKADYTKVVETEKKIPSYDKYITTLEFNNLTLKRLGATLTPPCGFSKNLSSKKREKRWFLVTFNIIIIHIFPENFIEIPQFVEKFWRIYLSILAIFINFHQFYRFFTFPCYKEPNDVSL